MSAEIIVSTERQEIRDYIEHWLNLKIDPSRPLPWRTDGSTYEALFNELRELDPDTCSREQLMDIMAKGINCASERTNDIARNRCDFCHRQREKLLQLGEQHDHEQSPVYICADCLILAGNILAASTC